MSSDAAVRAVPYDALKRAIDIAAASLLLIVLSPVLLIAALAVRLALGSPVLFTQDRPGMHGRIFRMVKFRTMRALTPGEPPGPESDARRLSGFGRWLRASSIDELPELWNVIRGEMSLVGPRPLLPEYLPLYSNVQARRHEVRPGITGLAQISGRNAIDWPTRLALDVQYVDQRSLLLDVRILLLTILRVVRREGVAQAGRDTVDRFVGDSHRSDMKSPVLPKLDDHA